MRVSAEREYAESFSNDSQYCHTRTVRPDRKVRGSPTRPSEGFFRSSANMRGMATNTGSHFQNCHNLLKRIPMRNNTLPSAPRFAVYRPVFTLAMTSR